MCAKVPGTETSYLALNEAVPALFESGNLPATIPSASAPKEAATDQTNKPKKAKSDPAAYGYIHKAVDTLVVADEDKKEETVAVEMDDDFLGVFDDDEDDAQPAAKEEAKQEEAPAQTAAPAQEGEAADNKKKKWEDGEIG